MHRMAIRCIGCGKWASRRAVWRKAAPARPPKPTRAVSAERFQRAVGVENLDAGAGLWVDVVERLTASALLEIGSHRMSPLGQSPRSSVVCELRNAVAHIGLILAGSGRRHRG